MLEMYLFKINREMFKYNLTPRRGVGWGILASVSKV